MALNVSRARVKDRCGVEDAALDASIDALIAEVVPVLEHAVRPPHLADPTPGVQATLQLGALEVVCGELLAQLRRAPGMADEVSVGGLSLRPPAGLDASDPSGMRRRGERRLAPFLREDVSGTLSGVATARPMPGGPD